jgi:hypothetical protein
MASSKEGVRSSGVSSTKGRPRLWRSVLSGSMRGGDKSKEANSEDVFILVKVQVRAESTPHYTTPPLTQHTIMTTFDYVDIPACATIVPISTEVKNQNQTDTKLNTSLPPSSNLTSDSASTSGNTPTRTVFGNLPGLLLASSLQIPTNVPNENPRSVSQLMSTRDPLSVPITTVNFRRFISRIGPVFWLQDRIEEIVTWKKGWKVTVLWMMAYSFLCQLGLSCLVNYELTAS